MDLLTVAERAFPTPLHPRTRPPGQSLDVRPRRWPKWAIIFDTETTTGAEQGLLFGSYAVARLQQGRYVVQQRGVFHADGFRESDPDGYATLQRFADSQVGLALMSRKDFIYKVFLPIAYVMRGLVVGFNLPFDISRIAWDVAPARGRFGGGFSFILAGDKRGENRHVPRIRIEALDSRRSFVAFSKPYGVSRAQLVPDGATDGRIQRGYVYQGRFLDLRTHAFAFTDRGHSLESACHVFGVKAGKGHAEQHGVITADYAKYNLQDVTAGLNLLNALKREHDRHPIDLLPDKALSPATVSKSYLDAMNVRPPLEANSDFPLERIGQAMSAYYGGRAECRIRNTSVPVVYVDFLSMYPTVNARMGNWALVTADRLEAVDATEELQAFLDEITLADLYKPETWRRLAWFGEIQPDGEILPVRADYDDMANGYQIGVNPFTSVLRSWYAGPDLVTAKLLTGRTPRLKQAWTLVPRGTQANLRPVALRNHVVIDPRDEDFYKRVIEARKSLKTEPGLSPEEQKRLDRLLKVVANSGSYGIYAEMNPDHHAKPQQQRICSGVGNWTAKARPEKPGRYCFPPLAALITAGARLMLAVLERSVTDLGGTYAMCDTDSMAIVATEHGGLVPCPHGPYKTDDGQDAIQALARDQVESIVERFSALNPYDPTRVPGSTLEIEKENYEGNDPRKPQQQLYVYVISAKRYALYNLTDDGQPVLRKWSEHGLGHLLNPVSPDDPDRDWIRQLWDGIVRNALGLPTNEPDWLDRPALTRTTISKPSVANPFRDFNRGKAHADQIKPFNFILNAHVTPLGEPAGIDPQHFQLIARYETDPARWEGMTWIDRDTGNRYRITTTGQATDTTARVQRYRDTVSAYTQHNEAKSSTLDQPGATWHNVSLLARRHVYELQRVHIGKESNRLVDVDAGDVHDLDDVLTSYNGPGTDAFTLWVLPILRQMSATVIAERCGLSKSYAHRIKSGRAPIPKESASRKRLALAAATECGLSCEPTASLLDIYRSIARSNVTQRTAHATSQGPARAS